ncbi:MAG: A/G-specific adenine glycosylase [Flavobacterium sp.]|nr:A/G-specific adenine glycosylase [Pedobacter sp.]
MDFANEIIAWYNINKRSLPWRETKDPYIIWLSEIIMQQTRVDQGTPYFNRFAEKYPTVADFAAASEDEILHLWQGLGYYSRGRNMLHTARMVLEEHGGYFPKNYDELLKLKGIGEYTAAAISSFSANEAKAVLDGNVFRLLSRFYGIDTPINSAEGKKIFTALANTVMDKRHAGIYNQAIMEFGSLQCKPIKPLCSICPLNLFCAALLKNDVDRLPVKIKIKKISKRYFNFVVAVKNEELLMQKRQNKDIWHNLYQLPLVETENPIDPEKLLQNPDFIDLFGADSRIINVSATIKHLLSHQTLFARFISIKNFSDINALSQGFFYANSTDFQKLAKPKLIFEFLKKFF